jgi:hypothetical protein
MNKLRSFLSVLAMVLAFQVVQAQQWEVLIQKIDTADAIRVSYLITDEAFKADAFYFTNEYPAYKDKIYPIDYISDFVVFYKNSREAYESLVSDTIKLKDDKIFRIQYTVHDNFGYNVFNPLSNYLREDMLLLNYPFVLGCFASQELQPFSVSVAEDTTKTVLNSANFYYFMKNPAVANAKHKFKLSELLHLDAYANKMPVAENKFFDILGKAIFSTQKFQVKDKKHPKTMVFVFDTLNLPSSAHNLHHSAIFYINENDLANDFETALLKIITTKMLRWYVAPPDVVNNREKYWFLEAATEYFSLKYLLKSGFISQEKFLEIMSEKYTKSLEFAERSLADISLGYMKNQEENAAGFASKGVITTWFFDNVVMSNSILTLEDIILGQFGKVDSEDLVVLNNAMHTFDTENVSANKPFSPEKFLNVWGILVENKNGKTSFLVNPKASKEQKEQWQRFIK